jgi:hypothetical protein
MRSGSEQADSTRASIDSARRKLGGRVCEASARAPGSLVQGTLRDGAHRTGVVLWASAGHCDVWFDDGIARRVRAGVVTGFAGPMPGSLVRVVAEARIFATLSEGDQVRWDRAGSVCDGCIIEKCRYGAIVLTGDGRLVAVGFRRLWPLQPRGTA